MRHARATLRIHVTGRRGLFGHARCRASSASGTGTGCCSPERPAGFDLGDLHAVDLHDVDVQRRAGASPYDVILAFTPDQRTLDRTFSDLARRLVSNGGLWIAWPKRSSGVPTDLDENIVRDVGLAAGLVDNKVCAIDETWSGLRFVVRLRDR